MARITTLIPVLMLLLISVASAFWSEKMDVYVIGSDGRALNNVTVNVVYQSTSCNAHADISKQTDTMGLAHFEFINTVDETFENKCVERTYRMIASFVGYTNTTIGSLNNTEKKYFITLPLTQHVLTILDGSGRAVGDASVMFANTTFLSDDSGTVYISLPVGAASNVEIRYGEIRETVSISPSEATKTITIPMYDLEVRLFDERGRRINGTVSIDGVQELSTSESPALFPRFSKETAKFNVTASGQQKFIDTTVTSDVLDIYFDFSPPAIRDVIETQVGRSLKVTVAVADDGSYASGLAANPLLSYTLAGNGSYSEAKMYPSTANQFESTIAAGGQNVSYRITVMDKQGNTNTYDGDYGFGGGKVIDEEKPARPLDITTLVGIFVFVAVVIFIYQKIRTQFS